MKDEHGGDAQTSLHLKAAVFRVAYMYTHTHTCEKQSLEKTLVRERKSRNARDHYAVAVSRNTHVLLVKNTLQV